MLLTQPCTYQGYFQVRYKDLETNTYVIKNRENLSAFNIFSIPDSASNNLVSNVDLKTRNIVLIYVATGSSANDFRIKKIDQIGSKICIQLNSVIFEDLGGTCDMGGLVFAFDAPKSYEKDDFTTCFDELYTSFDSTDPLPPFLVGVNLQE